MKRPNFKSVFLVVAISMAAAVALYLSYYAWTRSPRHGLPYHDSFTANDADEWKAFGGTWAINDGVMHNDSDERGAKLIAGSPHWKDYVVEADVKLLGRDGDAGLIVRSSDEEQGVDSYSGYYVGLRTRDNRLVLGRANHDWKEAQSVPLTGGVIPFEWYHLKVLVYGCEIVASASTLRDPAAATRIAFNDKVCAPSGRIGLRSYSSGGAWKNLVARLAYEADVRAALFGASAQSINVGAKPDPSDMPVFGSGSRPSPRNPQLPAPASAVQTINSLRLTAAGTKTTIRGVVILNWPSVFVEDSTAGVSISGDALPQTKIGDEVQVTGQVESEYYSTHLRNATMGILWPHAPVPPVSITAGQAASGSFNSMFVELEGTLRKKTSGPSNTIVLDLESDQQPYQAIVKVGRGDSLFRKMQLNSTVRLRGVSVVDAEYTNHRFPFVLLLRSADDLEVISGPPWWNMRHIVFLGLCVLILTMLGHVAQNRVERWRWRTILEEREHLAHEIHDTLAQSFAGLGFQLEAIRDRVPEDIPEIHQQLDLACDLVRRSHQEARRSIVALRRESGGKIELLSALEDCARKMLGPCHVFIYARQDGEVRPLPPTVSYTLFRIGQEALANSVRHGQPKTIRISVEYVPDRLILTLEDDGVGFTPGQETAGFGLQVMAKRAQGISAIAHVDSSPGMGTRVNVTVPLAPRMTWTQWPWHVWQIYRRYKSYVHIRKQMYPGTYRG